MKHPNPENRAKVQLEKRREFARLVLAWATVNLRSFPWRKTDNPYRILIAEIMLQRTKAEQVVPVYERFMMKYPDPTSLSAASVSGLRASIRSLGLEKRAPALKKLAKQIMKQHDGRIPCTKDGLLELHFVGNYTANALLCNAFGECVPTIDSNFARVLERVFSLRLGRPAQKDKRLWKFAESLMPDAKGSCRTFNLGIMDLASAICTPRKPSCKKCPLNTICDYGASVLNVVSLCPKRKRSSSHPISRKT